MKHDVPSQASHDSGIRHRTAEFRRVNAGMVAAGVATFGLLYCVQPLLPDFSRQFGVSAAASALSLSLTSAVLAVTMLVAGALSDAWGRKRIMTVSLFASAAIVLATAIAPTWVAFLALRALLGLTLGGVPAVAMTYLSEEVHPQSIGLGMGIYIAGNAGGGLAGRLIAGVLADFCGWRVGILVVGAVGLLAAVVFARCLPPSRRFVGKPLRCGEAVRRFRALFADAGLPWLFASGFVLLGAFVTVYNYISYRLLAPPFALSESVVGMIFSVYLVGIVSSSWIGHLAGRLGRRKVLWTMFVMMLAGLGLTLIESVGAIVLGIVVVTFGFFGGHSIVSSWVGRRSGPLKAQAAATYLFFYYQGSSVAGVVGGVFYARDGWPGVAAFVATLFGIGLAIAARLYRLEPLTVPQVQPLEPPLP